MTRRLTDKPHDIEFALEFRKHAASLGINKALFTYLLDRLDADDTFDWFDEITLSGLTNTQRKQLIIRNPRMIEYFSAAHLAQVSKASLKKIIPSLSYNYLHGLPDEYVIRYASRRGLFVHATYLYETDSIGTFLSLMGHSSMGSFIEDYKDIAYAQVNSKAYVYHIDMFFKKNWRNLSLLGEIYRHLPGIIDRLSRSMPTWLSQNRTQMRRMGYSIPLIKNKIVKTTFNKMVAILNECPCLGLGIFSRTDVNSFPLQKQLELVTLDWRIISLVDQPEDEVVQAAIAQNPNAALLVY